jgi:hypothetical protein
MLDLTPQRATVLGPDRSRLYLDQPALDYWALLFKTGEAASS